MKDIDYLRLRCFVCLRGGWVDCNDDINLVKKGKKKNNEILKDFYLYLNNYLLRVLLVRKSVLDVGDIFNLWKFLLFIFCIFFFIIVFFICIFFVIVVIFIFVVVFGFIFFI